MLYLSGHGIENWKALAAAVEQDPSMTPADTAGGVPGNLRTPFHFYVGTMLAAKGRIPAARKWLEAGSLSEPLPACSYMLDLIERQGGALSIPEVTFSDPEPWVHFSSLPELCAARDRFLELASGSLPTFSGAFSMLDIGCGNGELGVRLIEALIAAGKVERVGSVMLMDPSAGMLELAGRNVARAFPGAEVRLLETRLEDAGELSPCDVAIASLAVHHMPAETKRVHLGRLGETVDHFLLMELEANHDYPELHSPEIAFSVYQVFGRGLQFVFNQDAPAEVHRKCADMFLMTEAVSLLSEPRGDRTEYHMLRRQWRDLLDEAMTPGFSCLCDATCYSDPFVEQMTIHYARNT